MGQKCSGGTVTGVSAHHKPHLNRSTPAWVWELSDSTGGLAVAYDEPSECEIGSDHPCFIDVELLHNNTSPPKSLPLSPPGSAWPETVSFDQTSNVSFTDAIEPRTQRNDHPHEDYDDEEEEEEEEDDEEGHPPPHCHRYTDDVDDEYNSEYEPFVVHSADDVTPVVRRNGGRFTPELLYDTEATPEPSQVTPHFADVDTLEQHAQAIASRSLTPGSNIASGSDTDTAALIEQGVEDHESKEVTQAFDDLEENAENEDRGGTRDQSGVTSLARESCLVDDISLPIQQPESISGYPEMVAAHQTVTHNEQYTDEGTTMELSQSLVQIIAYSHLTPPLEDTVASVACVQQQEPDSVTRCDTQPHTLATEQFDLGHIQTRHVTIHDIESFRNSCRNITELMFVLEDREVQLIYDEIANSVLVPAMLAFLGSPHHRMLWQFELGMESVILEHLSVVTSFICVLKAICKQPAMCSLMVEEYPVAVHADRSRSLAGDFGRKTYVARPITPRPGINEHMADAPCSLLEYILYVPCMLPNLLRPILRDYPHIANDHDQAWSAAEYHLVLLYKLRDRAMDRFHVRHRIAPVYLHDQHLEHEVDSLIRGRHLAKLRFFAGLGSSLNLLGDLPTDRVRQTWYQIFKADDPPLTRFFLGLYNNNRQGPSKWLLHEAARTNATNTVQLMLQQDHWAQALYQQDEHGFRPLEIAKGLSLKRMSKMLQQYMDQFRKQSYKQIHVM